jgi:hypothetical protein
LEIKESSEALKQLMLHKIRLKKAELFSLKKDNFGEDIDVVIQQNYHYINQLDYQTKHFEYLILQNEKLKMQLEGMVSNYEVHKKIQSELAKRIFMSTQIVNELTNKNEKAEKRKQELVEKLEAAAKEVLQSESLRSGQSLTDSKELETEREVTELQATKSQLIAENHKLRKRLTGFYNCVYLLEETVAREKENIAQKLVNSVPHQSKSIRKGTTASSSLIIRGFSRSFELMSPADQVAVLETLRIFLRETKSVG